ncbi:hypothetical protein [Lonsdalea quercina]|uniref:hypothetical protein n=1 Tax=Lonsdalea quercina TaxID=71657 RepID=UPI003974E49E
MSDGTSPLNPSRIFPLWVARHQFRSGLVWSGLVWSGLVWSGLVWSGLVWSGLVWSGLQGYRPYQWASIVAVKHAPFAEQSIRRNQLCHQPKTERYPLR